MEQIKLDIKNWLTSETLPFALAVRTSTALSGGTMLCRIIKLATDSGGLITIKKIKVTAGNSSCNYSVEISTEVREPP